MDNLHSRQNEELEERDQKMFARVVVSAAVAAVIIFIVGFVIICVSGTHLPGLNTASHFTSAVVLGARGFSAL